MATAWRNMFDGLSELVYPSSRSRYQRRSLAVIGTNRSGALFKKRAFRLLFGLLFIPLTSLAEPVENPPEAIRGVLEHLESCPAVPRTLDQAALVRLSALYPRHGFEPLWTSYAQIQD